MALSLCLGCVEQRVSDKPVLFSISELIDEQILQLQQEGDSVTKVAEVDGKQSGRRFLPTAESWGAELDIYRQLDLVNKTIYESEFHQAGPLEDPKSNLQIQEFSSETAPLSLLLVYYQESVNRVRKIEGVLKESNPLYTSWKKLTLEFEETGGKASLTSYGIEGFQKVAFRDTVRFSIRVHISD